MDRGAFDDRPLRDGGVSRPASLRLVKLDRFLAFPRRHRCQTRESVFPFADYLTPGFLVLSGFVLVEPGFLWIRRADVFFVLPSRFLDILGQFLTRGVRILAAENQIVELRRQVAGDDLRDDPPAEILCGKYVIPIRQRHGSVSWRFRFRRRPPNPILIKRAKLQRLLIGR